MRMRNVAGLAVLVGALSACGSTVSAGSGTAAQGSLADGGLGLGLASAAPSALAGGDAGVTPGASISSSAAPTQDPSAGTLDNGSLPSSTSGVLPADHKPILIGYPSSRAAASVISSLGISANIGDLDADAKAMAAKINASGGLLGHPIQLVNHDFPASTTASGADSAAEAGCTDWTSDHHVFAVVDTALGLSENAVMLACLNKAHVPLISNGAQQSSIFAANPLLVAPSSMTSDKYVPALVDRLWADGFFGGWDAANGKPGSKPVKIGAQSFDTPESQHYIAVLRSALAKHGLKIDLLETHSENVTSVASSTSSAVLRFKAEGITHVFNANVLFYKDADTQGYYPHYAVDDYIETVQLLAKNASQRQLHGSMGAGFQPLSEVEGTPDISPAATSCFATMRKAGQDTSDQFTKTVMAQVCDDFLIVQQGFLRSKLLSQQGLIQGITELGSAFQSALTYPPTFGPGKRFGANRVRDYAYNDACTCYRFTSAKTYAVP